MFDGIRTVSRCGRTLARPLLGLLVVIVAGGCSGSLDNDLGVQLVPADGTQFAHPDTAITFRGDGARQLTDVSVEGSLSGPVDGDIVQQADGAGMTFRPRRALQPGEDVTVQATGLSGYDFSVASVAGPPVLDQPDVDDEDPATALAVPGFEDRLPPVVTTEGDLGEDPYLLTPVADGEVTNGTLITDPAGEPIWWRPTPDDDVTVGNLSVTELDGQPVLTWFEGTDPYGVGRYQGEWVIIDDTYTEIARIGGGNGIPADIHDIELTDRGTAWIMAYHPVTVDLSDAGGSAQAVVIEAVVMEVDIDTEEVYFEWHSLDHIDIDASLVAGPESDEKILDYAHINSLDEGPDGDIVISLRNTSQVLQIDRQSGEVDWILGGEDSTIDVGDDPGPSYQHHVRWLPDGTLSVFDNGNDHDPERSRGVVYDIDVDGGTAEVVREYTEDVFTGTQGSLQTLPDAGALATWTEVSRVDRYDPSGRRVGTMHTGPWSYRVLQQPWTATPTDLPLITPNGDQLQLSWNGATEVSSWQVLAGSDGDGMTPWTTVARSGFATTIDRPDDAVVVAVALDQDGAVLGRSDPWTR